MTYFTHKGKSFHEVTNQRYVPSLKLTVIAPKKWWFPIGIYPYSRGRFSGAKMLVSGRVLIVNGTPEFPEVFSKYTQDRKLPKNTRTSCQSLGNFPRIRDPKLNHFPRNFILGRISTHVHTPKTNEANPKVGTEMRLPRLPRIFEGRHVNHVSGRWGGVYHIRTPIESAPTWTFQFGCLHGSVRKKGGKIHHPLGFSIGTP